MNEEQQRNDRDLEKRERCGFGELQLVGLVRTSSRFI